MSEGLFSRGESYLGRTIGSLELQRDSSHEIGLAEPILTMKITALQMARNSMGRLNRALEGPTYEPPTNVVPFQTDGVETDEYTRVTNFQYEGLSVQPTEEKGQM